ncbi:MAG: cytochrome ubiquinol oxidase subunit I [Spirochaetales bacterium]
MDGLVLLLSRVQFGLEAGLHFIFPPTTLGLAFFILLVESAYLFTKKEEFKKLSNFAIRLLTLVFALGVATGLPLPFAFGMNWAEFSKHAGSYFGVQLAVEATVAFTLESVFIGVLFFGRDKMKPVWYWLSAVFVFLGSHVSALIIIMANSWMQTPAGVHLDAATGKLIMDSFWAVNFNPSTLLRFLHTITGAWMTAAFLLVAAAAWHFKHEREVPLAKTLMLWAGSVALVAAIAMPLIGHASTLEIEKTQPAKGAAMEGIYETQKNAPLYFFGWVDEATKTTSGFSVPGMLSWFYTFDTNFEVKGLNDPALLAKTGGQIPPVNAIFQSFRLMVLTGTTALGVILLAMIFFWKDTLIRKKKSLNVVIWTSVLPYVSLLSGWFTAEVGRQPFIIYPFDNYPGMVLQQAITQNQSEGNVWFSLIFFNLVYVVVYIVFFRFLPKMIKAGISGGHSEGGKA